MKNFYKVELYRYSNAWYDTGDSETEDLLTLYFSTLEKAKKFCENCAEVLGLRPAAFEGAWKRVFGSDMDDEVHIEFMENRWIFWNETVCLHYKVMLMDIC